MRLATWITQCHLARLKSDLIMENKLTDASSTNIDGNFFSVAMTTPFAAARIKYQIYN